MRYCIFRSRPMASFPGYTIVSNNGFQIDYNITITLTLEPQARLYRRPVNRFHHHHLLSLLNPKADTHFTVPRRVEG